MSRGGSWFPRVLLFCVVMYASVILFWSARNFGAFNVLEATSSGHFQEQQLSILISQDTSMADFPSGDTKIREVRCITWRSTRECSPEGPRQPTMDRNCTDIIPAGQSGYCEVEDVSSEKRFRMMKLHCNSIRRGVPFRCSDAQKFVDFRAQAYVTMKMALSSEFLLPNVLKSTTTTADGIVMVVYPKLLASAYATISVLRLVFRCQLPIEIWFRPDEMKSNEILIPLRRRAASESNITFQEIHDPLAKRFVAKVYAIYHSSFDRILFLDADNVPVRDPSYLFASLEFVRTGAVFWPDFWHPSSTIFNIHKTSLLWELLDTPFVDMFEQESGQLMIDRRRHAIPLELVRFYASCPDIFSSLKLTWGDKDLFRFAWLKLEVPFHMIQTPPGMAGVIIDSSLTSVFCGMTMVQHDTNGGILFLHRNHQKLSGSSQLMDIRTYSNALDSHGNNYPDPAI
ncbi:unnamed protein product [Phytophthora lilii]|uniref:Unnamed protein product n=1 Tax=Phytophthora lilii TaxID=2077276 RepID=A0A9W6WVA5_9STRA|nr:unnamed protein product [Phytophthora lilii]